MPDSLDALDAAAMLMCEEEEEEGHDCGVNGSSNCRSSCSPCRGPSSHPSSATPEAHAHASEEQWLDGGEEEEEGEDDDFQARLARLLDAARLPSPAQAAASTSRPTAPAAAASVSEAALPAHVRILSLRDARRCSDDGWSSSLFERVTITTPVHSSSLQALSDAPRGSDAFLSRCGMAHVCDHTAAVGEAREHAATRGDCSSRDAEGHVRAACVVYLYPDCAWTPLLLRVTAGVADAVQVRMQRAAGAGVQVNTVTSVAAAASHAAVPAPAPTAPVHVAVPVTVHVAAPRKQQSTSTPHVHGAMRGTDRSSTHAHTSRVAARLANLLTARRAARDAAPVASSAEVGNVEEPATAVKRPRAEGGATRTGEKRARVEAERVQLEPSTSLPTAPPVARAVGSGSVRPAAAAAVTPVSLPTLSAGDMEALTAWSERCARFQVALASAYQCLPTSGCFTVTFASRARVHNVILITQCGDVPCAVIACVDEAFRSALARGGVAIESPTCSWARTHARTSGEAGGEDAALLAQALCDAAQAGVQVSEVARIRACDAVRGLGPASTTATGKATLPADHSCTGVVSGDGVLQLLRCVAAAAQHPRAAGAVPLTTLACVRASTRMDVPVIAAPTPFTHASRTPLRMQYARVQVAAGEEHVYELRVNGPIFSASLARMCEGVVACVPAAEVDRVRVRVDMYTCAAGMPAAVRAHHMQPSTGEQVVGDGVQSGRSDAFRCE